MVRFLLDDVSSLLFPISLVEPPRLLKLLSTPLHMWQVAAGAPVGTYHSLFFKAGKCASKQAPRSFHCPYREHQRKPKPTSYRLEYELMESTFLFLPHD